MECGAPMKKGGAPHWKGGPSMPEVRSATLGGWNAGV